MNYVKVKAGKTIEVKCHCRKTVIKVQTETDVEVKIVVWCSKECREDWYTGGM